MMKTVSFAINEEDFQRFNVLEAIATTTDTRWIDVLMAMLRHIEGRRKYTEEERKQRAEWMDIPLDWVAE